MSTGRDSLAEVLAAVDDEGTAHEPVTAREIAEQLGCTRAKAADKLEELRKRGEIRSKAVGAQCRVWWRPAGADPPGERTSDPDVRSERTRPEAELTELFERVDHGLFALDEELRFTYANARAREILDVSGRDVVGTDARDAPFITDTAETPLRKATNHREQVTCEEYCESTDTWLELQAYPSANGAFVYVRDVTDRREREQELQRYERLSENLPVGVYRNTPGPDGEFVEVNDTLASIFDADSEAELLEHSVSDLYPDPEERADFSRRLGREGIVEDVELKQETLAGEQIWISVTAMRTEEDGEVFFDGIVKDVTERKEAQQQLEEERDMFAEGPAVVFRWKPDEEAGWPVEYVSENVEDVLGYAPAELESGDVPYTDLLLDEEIDRIADEVERNSDETTERFSHEPYRVRTKDGGVRWVRDTTKIVRDETGDITHYLGYLVDITERRERERALEQSEQRYRTLAEAFPNGVVALFDEDLRYTLAAGQAFEDLPVSRDDVEGRTVRDAWGDGVADELGPVCRGVLDGERNSIEVSYVGREWVIYAVPITDENGDVFAGMTMAQDITERTENRRKLERQNERLESFASMLAHELRNPVTIGQIYSRQLPPEVDTEAVEYVTEAFDRIEDMIDVMLVLTRGREAVGESTAIELATVVREAWNDIDAPDAALDVDLDRTIQADETYVRHMFRNLLENAVEHGSAGPRSQAREDTVEHGGSDVAVTVGGLSSGFYVADDGEGIPPEDREAVFDEGYTTAADGRGTGLGLAFVRKLAEVYEWDVTVTESEAGGARFEFRNVA